MLKTMLMSAALTLALFSAAQARGYPGGNNEGQTPKHVFPGDTGLPAHHGEGDVKPPPPAPQDIVQRPRIPPKIHGPYPGPIPHQL